MARKITINNREWIEDREIWIVDVLDEAEDGTRISRIEIDLPEDATLTDIKNFIKED